MKEDILSQIDFREIAVNRAIEQMKNLITNLNNNIRDTDKEYQTNYYGNVAKIINNTTDTLDELTQVYNQSKRNKYGG